MLCKPKVCFSEAVWNYKHVISLFMLSCFSIHRRMFHSVIRFSMSLEMFTFPSLSSTFFTFSLFLHFWGHGRITSKKTILFLRSLSHLNINCACAIEYHVSYLIVPYSYKFSVTIVTAKLSFVPLSYQNGLLKTGSVLARGSPLQCPA